MTTTVNSSMLHSTKFQKMFVAFFGTQLRRYIYIYICKCTTVGQMTRVTDIVKLIKNMMQLEAHQLSSFLILATNNSFTEEG